MKQWNTPRRSFQGKVQERILSSPTLHRDLPLETPKRSLPLHIYLGGRELERETLHSALKSINEERISALWVDVHSPSDLEAVKSLVSSFDGLIIGVVNDPSLISPVLENGCRGITFSPRAGKKTDFFIKEILKHRTAFEKEEVQVYLPVLQAPEQSEKPTGTPPPIIPEESKTAYLEKIREALLMFKKMRNEGILHTFINIEHENSVFLFNLCRRLKEQVGTRHIFTLRCEDGSEEDLIKDALTLGPLFYSGIGEALLITLTHGLPLPIERLRKSADRARLILRSIDLAPAGLRVISCPTCGRCSMKLTSVAHRVEHELRELEGRLRNEGKRAEDSGGVTVAVMGCSVNGPGEARAADIGIAGRKDRSGVLFKLGQPFKTVHEEQLVEEIVKHTEALVRQKIEALSPQT